jgi:hypothetical protein
MMTRIAVALLALSLMPAAVAGAGRSAAPSFGVASARDGILCATIDGADARVGERVAVVFPSLPQAAAWARLEAIRDAGQCAALRARDPAGRLFVLQLEQPLPDDDGGIGIVVRGARGFGQRHARVVAQLASGSAWFVSCTSSEGLHLGAWATPRPVGTPLWHAYFYLGYDTEPDCLEAETRDAPAQASASSTSRRNGTVIRRLAASEARSSRSSNAVSPPRSRPTRRSSQS